MSLTKLAAATRPTFLASMRGTALEHMWLTVVSSHLPPGRGRMSWAPRRTSVRLVSPGGASSLPSWVGTWSAVSQTDLEAMR